MIGLAADTQLLDKFTVPRNVFAFKITKEAFALANKGQQGTPAGVILLVFFQVTGQAFNPIGEKRNLPFNGAGIIFLTAILRIKAAPADARSTHQIIHGCAIEPLFPEHHKGVVQKLIPALVSWS